MNKQKSYQQLSDRHDWVSEAVPSPGHAEHLRSGFLLRDVSRLISTGKNNVHCGALRFEYTSVGKSRDQEKFCAFLRGNKELFDDENIKNVVCDMTANDRINHNKFEVICSNENSETSIEFIRKRKSFGIIDRDVSDTIILRLGINDVQACKAALLVAYDFAKKTKIPGFSLESDFPMEEPNTSENIFSHVEIDEAFKNDRYSISFRSKQQDLEVQETMENPFSSRPPSRQNSR
jgi:hypothetical protein